MSKRKILLGSCLLCIAGCFMHSYIEQDKKPAVLFDVSSKLDPGERAGIYSFYKNYANIILDKHMYIYSNLSGHSGFMDCINKNSSVWFQDTIDPAQAFKFRHLIYQAHGYSDKVEVSAGNYYEDYNGIHHEVGSENTTIGDLANGAQDTFGTFSQYCSQPNGQIPPCFDYDFVLADCCFQAPPEDAAPYGIPYQILNVNNKVESIILNSGNANGGGQQGNIRNRYRVFWTKMLKKDRGIGFACTVPCVNTDVKLIVIPKLEECLRDKTKHNSLIWQDVIDEIQYAAFMSSGFLYASGRWRAIYSTGICIGDASNMDVHQVFDHLPTSKGGGI